MADDGGRRLRRRAWLLAGVAFVAVTVVMLYPMDAGGGPSLWPHLDKLVHFGAWLALAVTLWPALRGEAPARRWWRAAGLIGALGLWGVAVELLQGLVPPRTPDAWDALADLLGAAVGTVARAGWDARVAARVSTAASAKSIVSRRVEAEQPLEEISS